MSMIDNIQARQILDRFGNPSLEVDCYLEDGSFGRASVSGTGCNEKALDAINDIIGPELEGMDSLDLASTDIAMHDLSGSKNKISCNALSCVSFAVAKASADFLGIPAYQRLGSYGATSLPVPMLTVVDGLDLEINRIMLVPTGASCFAEAISWVSDVAGELYSENYLGRDISDADKAVKTVLDAVEEAGYTTGPENDFMLALSLNPEKKLNSSQKTSFISGFSEKHPVFFMDVNSYIIDINTCSTLTDLYNGVKKAKRAGLRVLLDLETEQTEDNFLSDLAVALEVDFVMVNNLGGSASKLNQLIRIEEELDGSASYAGSSAHIYK